MTATCPSGSRRAQRSLVSDLLARHAHHARGVFLADKSEEGQNVHSSRRWLPTLVGKAGRFSACPEIDGPGRSIAFAPVLI